MILNNWILAYYQAICDGSVIVGKWVQIWYKKVVHGIENGEYLFDIKKANRAIKFIERYCHHHEGALAPGRITLEMWQKALISVLFGIVDEDGSRHFRECFVVIGRKNGKTLLAAAILAYMSYMDGEYGARGYICAPKLDQSRLCYEAFFQMVKKEPDMADGTVKRRTDIYIKDCNASVQPLAFSSRKSDGLNPHICVCDEISSWAGDQGIKQYEVLRSALGARRHPILLSISTSGYVNEGIYDELIKRCTFVLMGSSQESRLAPFLYIIDDFNKWNDINELRKANPNLGVSVSTDYMLEEIAVAEGSLPKKMEFLTKYCNVKQNSSQAWLSTETVQKAYRLEKHTLEDFRGSYAVAGIDLSQTTDLTACTVAIERDGLVHVFTKFFLPREKISEATNRDGLPYQQYIKRGLLQPSGDNLVDYQDCFRYFTDLVEKYEIYPLAIGIDRYSALQLTKQLTRYGFKTELVVQGYNLTGIVRMTEGMLKDGTLVIGEDNPLMRVHMLDSALKVDNESRTMKLVKVAKNAHIDGMASLLDAMCMRRNYYDQLGEQLANRGD